MPPAPPDSHTRGAVRVFTIAFLVTLVGVAFVLKDYATDFILGAVFAGLLAKNHQRLTGVLKGREKLSAAIVTVALALAIAIPATFIVTSVTVEAAEAYESSKEDFTIGQLEKVLFGDHWLANMARRISKPIGFEYNRANLQKVVGGVMGTVAKNVYERATKIGTNVVLFLLHYAMMLMIFFYLLLDGSRLKAFMFELSPLPDDEEELLVRKFMDVGRATLFGNGIGSLLQGVFGGIAMAIAGIPNPVLWGTVMTIFAFLPLVGISVVTIPAAIYLFGKGQIFIAIVFFVFCTAVGLVVENVVKTRLIGQQMKMHDLLIFLSIIGGLTVFGVLGLFYGPLVVAIFLTLHELYITHYKRRIVGPELD